MKIKSDPTVAKKFAEYPAHIQPIMNQLRQLIINTADTLESVVELEETLKWGEPSYLTKHGSTIRIDWKDKSPDQYAMYFQCTSQLIPSFKVVFDDTFQYEGSRAIIFNLDEDLPVDELKKCITAGLTYHKVKNKHLLDL